MPIHGALLPSKTVMPTSASSALTGLGPASAFSFASTAASTFIGFALAASSSPSTRSSLKWKFDSFKISCG
jgi:hypothetical protein